MARTIRTSEGDRLDALCQHVYGRLAGSVEAVLAANPGLAGEPQPFAAGIVIDFPDLPARVEKPVNLWS